LVYRTAIKTRKAFEKYTFQSPLQLQLLSVRYYHIQSTCDTYTNFWHQCLGYHIVHILLYAEPALQDESYVPLIQEQAMQITNIAISDFPAALKVFSTHGLFYGTSVICQSPHRLVRSCKAGGLTLS
jgi:hypothetical protein